MAKAVNIMFFTYYLACDDGLFGYDCETRCYCESEVCNKATGKCPQERCERGWMGATCSEGIITNLTILYIKNRSHVLRIPTQFVDTIHTPTSKLTAYM